MAARLQAVAHRLKPQGRDDADTVDSAPGDIAPAGPVPQARRQPYDDQGKGRRQGPAEARAKDAAAPFRQPFGRAGDGDRIIEVRFEPSAQGDMPPAPVFGDRF